MSHNRLYLRLFMVLTMLTGSDLFVYHDDSLTSKRAICNRVYGVRKLLNKLGPVFR